MSRERGLALQQGGLRDWIEMLSASAPGSRMIERDGVAAAVVPSCPERSICNSVGYTDAGALAASLDVLASAYEDAGVAAWTVWVPEFDTEAIALLEAAGHKLDGTPTAMSRELASLEPLDPGDLDWDTRPERDLLGHLNERAYGLPEDSGVAAALSDPPHLPNLRLYQARVDGEAAAVLATLDSGDDLGFYFVATDPDRRGRGLASRLMSIAMVEGRERGLATTSLQSSVMGRPIYERLGFKVDFELRMYERRR
jgi:ribosomal protein S18 acetylase RimI-like enzyme